MIKRIVFVLSLLCIYFLSTLTFTRCAQIVKPGGGKKDTIPPHIVEKYSTPNYQKNFKPQRIVLTFDEWIRLDEPNSQVVVSPPLIERPNIKLDGKKVIVEFAKKEILKDSVTYTIQFGNAVKDLSEGNVAPKLKFVFATGDVLDSLIFTAKVIDVITQLPIENALVMLYADYSDSVVAKQKPFYFARTDKSGFASIENVRGGKYKVFALLEKDNNYLYSAEGEKIAYADTLITVFGRDTARSKAFVLKMFEPERKMQLVTKETDAFGLVRLGYTAPPTSAKIIFDSVFNANAIVEISRDSLLFWYDVDSDIGAQTLVVNQKIDTTAISDTVKIRVKGRADFFKKKQKLLCSTPNALNKSPNQPIQLAFNFPILKFDTALISITDTSKKQIPFKINIDSAHRRNVSINSNLGEGKYTLQILPAALKSLHDFVNDSLKFSIFVPDEKEFGEEDLRIMGLDSLKNYQIQLTLGDDVIVGDFAVSNTKTFSKNIPFLKPDRYILRIFEDENTNHVWDTGNYYKHRAPEKIYTQQLAALRPNWTTEVPIDLKDTLLAK